MTAFGEAYILLNTGTRDLSCIIIFKLIPWSCFPPRIQGCLLYLTDPDVQAMLQKAAVGLKKDGLIIVKENICSGTNCAAGFVANKNQDNSLTRSDAYMIKLFEQSNMQVGR